MKKKTVIILCAVLAVLIAGGGIAWSFLPHPLNYKISSVEYIGSSLSVTDSGEDFVTVQKSGEGDMKILMFTDIHLDGDNSTSLVTVTKLVENIQKEKPDLVLFGGDNATSGLNRVRCKQLGKIFEKLGVYWGGIIGNHEGDNPFSISRESMMDIFCSFPHCLMKKGLSDVTGNCNYAIEILNSDSSMSQTFFFLDTFDEMSEETKAEYADSLNGSEYDGAKADQVEWYAKKAESLKAQYGNYKSTLIMHIPLPQLASAAETEDFLYGGKLENICCSGFDSGVFDAVKNAGTQAVFCGHDHLNNFGLYYEGVLLSYIEPSGYGSYTTASVLGYEEKDWIQGYTLLTLHEDGSFENKQIRNSESNN